MPNIASAKTIPISLFDHGHAEQIFEEVKRSGPKVVMKDDIAECVLISHDEYIRLMEEIEDAEVLALANERLAHFDPATLISQEEIYAEFGITEEDLKGWEEVEFE